MSNWKPKVFCGLILEWLCFAVGIIGILGSPAIGIVRLPYVRVIAATGVLIGCALSFVLNEIHDDEAWKIELGTIQFALKVVLGILALAWLASLIKIKDPNSFAATLRSYCNKLFNWKWPIIEIVFVVDRLLHIVSRMAGTNDFLAAAYRRFYVVLLLVAIVAVAIVVFKFPKSDKNTADEKKNETHIENDDNPNEKNALEEVVVAAEKGDASAQYQLGLMYYSGESVEQDFDKAFQWFLKAAERGEPSSQFWVGLMYQYGKGVSVDYEKAMEWFLKAANQGRSTAMFSIGVMYYRGQGVAIDYRTAETWFLSAAEYGDTSGMFYLGEIYQNGYLGYIDTGKAKECYQKAAEDGSEAAKEKLKDFSVDVVGTATPTIGIKPDDYLTKSIERLQEGMEQGEYKQVISGEEAMYCLRHDGSIEVFGCSEEKDIELEKIYSNWSDVTSITIMPTYGYDEQESILGIKSDGSVLAIPGAQRHGKIIDVSGWRNVASLTVIEPAVIAVSSSGEVMGDGVAFIDFTYADLSLLYGCKKIVSTSTKEDNVWGLTPSGEVIDMIGAVQEGYQVSYDWDGNNWIDIVDITTSYDSCFALTKKGKVLYCWGHNHCNKDFSEDVYNWSDITSIAAGYDHIVALKKDGTLYAVQGRRSYDSQYGQCDVGEWKNIVRIEAWGDSTVGYASNGRVYFAGYNCLQEALSQQE